MGEYRIRNWDVCLSASLSEELDAIVDEGDDANENQVEGQIDVEKTFARFVLGADEQHVFYDDHADQQRHLVLNAFVDEPYICST